MVADKDIANLALTRIGADMITSLESDNESRAVLCKELLPIYKRAVLRLHPWSFALKRQALSRVSDQTGMWKYSYAFQLPTDPKCLRVIESDADKYGVPWTIEGGYLVTNNETITITYIADITEPGLYDAQFVEVLAARLAWALAKPIAGDDKLLEDCRSEYLLLLGEAQASDGQEETVNEGDQGANVFTDVRFG
jgi:hypothetical protein